MMIQLNLRGVNNMKKIAVIVFLMTSLALADNKEAAFNKVMVDKLFNEQDISKLKVDVCRLYIKTNSSEEPIIIRIEDGKETGSVVIKGAKKEKLNYFYKYIKDGTYNVSKKQIISFFKEVNDVGFMKYKRSDYELQTGPSRLGDKYLIECKIEGAYNFETGRENDEEKNYLSGLSQSIQMIAANNIPIEKYNMANELKQDYSKLMEEMKEPICSKDVDKELSVFSVVPYFDEDDKKRGYPKLPPDKEVKGFMFGFLLKYVLKNDEYFLKYRDYNYGFIGAVVQPLMDINQIKRLEVDELMKETNNKLEKIKMIPPDFIWKDLGYEYITVYKNGSECHIFYDVRRCIECKFKIVDMIWQDIRKNMEHLFRSAAGKRKIYKETPN